MILSIIIFQLITIYKIDSSLLYPEMVNVGKFKPTSLNPLGSSCGLELQGKSLDNKSNNVTRTNLYCNIKNHYVIIDFKIINSAQIQVQ